MELTHMLCVLGIFRKTYFRRAHIWPKIHTWFTKRHETLLVDFLKKLRSMIHKFRVIFSYPYKILFYMRGCSCVFDLLLGKFSGVILFAFFVHEYWRIWCVDCRQKSTVFYVNMLCCYVWIFVPKIFRDICSSNMCAWAILSNNCSNDI